MYVSNYLAKRLRAASIGRDSAPFAELSGGRTVTYGELFQAAEKTAAGTSAIGTTNR